MVEKWQRDCRPTKPSYSSRHPAPIQPGMPLSRCAWPLLIRSLATAASLNKGFHEIRHRCLRVAFHCRLRSLASYSIVFKQCPRNLQNNKGVWKETTESAPTLQLSRVVIGKRHNKWHITAGSDNVRFRRDTKISKSELRQLQRRTPAGDRCKSYV